MAAEEPKTDPHRFTKLPEHIALEDTVEEHPTVDPPDPKLGRDTEQDFFMRHVSG